MRCQFRVTYTHATCNKVVIDAIVTPNCLIFFSSSAVCMLYTCTVCTQFWLHFSVCRHHHHLLCASCHLNCEKLGSCCVSVASVYIVYIRLAVTMSSFTWKGRMYLRVSTTTIYSADFSRIDPEWVRQMCAKHPRNNSWRKQKTRHGYISAARLYIWLASLCSGASPFYFCQKFQAMQQHVYMYMDTKNFAANYEWNTGASMRPWILQTTRNFRC